MSDQILTNMMLPLLEVIGERVVHTDGQERLQYWNAFTKLHSVFPHKDVLYGAVHSRWLFGSILCAVTVATEMQLGNEIPELDTGFPKAAFGDWTIKDWKALEDLFVSAIRQVKRKDAAFHPGDLEDANVNPEIETDDLVGKRAQKIVRYIKLFGILSPVRKNIEDQLADESQPDKKVATLPKKMLSKLWETASKEEDTGVRDALRLRLFDSEKPAEKLRNLGELRKSFNGKPFTFDSFEDRINALMSEWCELLFDEPALNSFYFPDEASDEQNISQLIAARHALKENGQDPLEAAVRLAETIQPQPRSATRGRATPSGSNPAPPARRSSSRLLGRKRTATRLTFEEDEVVDENEDPEYEGEQRRTLSKLPKRARVANKDDDFSPKSRKSQQKKYKGRRKWTDEEKLAIIEGIRKFGMGEWAKIKEEYDGILGHRTSGQVKDCFRTMLKREEVPIDIVDEEV